MRWRWRAPKIHIILSTCLLFPAIIDDIYKTVKRVCGFVSVSLALYLCRIRSIRCSHVGHHYHHTFDNFEMIVYFGVKLNVNPKNMIYTILISINACLAEYVSFSLSLSLCVCAQLLNDINAICSLIKYFTFQPNRHIAQNDLQCCIDYLLIQPCELF